MRHTVTPKKSLDVTAFGLACPTSIAAEESGILGAGMTVIKAQFSKSVIPLYSYGLVLENNFVCESWLDMIADPRTLDRLLL